MEGDGGLSDMASTLEKIKWYKKVYGTRKTCRYLKNKVLYGYMDDYPRWQKKHAMTSIKRMKYD